VEQKDDENTGGHSVSDYWLKLRHVAEKEGYTDGTSTRNGQRDITGFISSRNIRCKDDSSSGSCHKSKQTRKRSRKPLPSGTSTAD